MAIKDYGLKVFAAKGRKDSRQIEVWNESGHGRAGFSWWKRAFYVSRAFGQSKAQIEEYKAGVRGTAGSRNPLYDCRVISTEGVAHLKELHDKIEALQAERTRYIEDNFLTWPIAKESDFAEPKQNGLATRAEAEAESKSPKWAPPGKEELASESRVVSELNRFFR